MTNKTNDGLIQSSSKTNIGDNVNNNRYRVTREVAGNSKTDLNKSVRNDCPDPSVLARHNPFGPETDNRHMATEMGLPRNGNSDTRNTVMRTDEHEKYQNF